MKIICQNKRINHFYEQLERYEAGIVLKGSEVKSLRLGMVDIKTSFAKIHNNEVFLYNCHIAPYDKAFQKLDPKRPKKLLLKRHQIHSLMGKLKKLPRLTLVPKTLFFNRRGLAKVELVLVRGLAKYDIREKLKEKALRRELRSITPRYH